MAHSRPTANTYPNRWKDVPVARSRTSLVRAEQSASLVDVEQVLHNYDATFLECRDLRHSWTVVGYYRLAGEVRRTLSCERCPVMRTDVWRSNGERVKASYDYPDDYQIKGGGVQQYDVRREILHRVTIFDSEQDMTRTLIESKPMRSTRLRSATNVNRRHRRTAAAK